MRAFMLWDRSVYSTVFLSLLMASFMAGTTIVRTTAAQDGVRTPASSPARIAGSPAPRRRTNGEANGVAHAAAETGEE